MKLDRHTARALVDANMMSLAEYIERFGSSEEKDGGLADGLKVERVRPASRPCRIKEKEEEPVSGFPFEAPRAAMIRFHWH